jgi:hypothetical protein
MAGESDGAAYEERSDDLVGSVRGQSSAICRECVIATSRRRSSVSPRNTFSDHACRISGDERLRGDRTCHDSAGGDNGSVADLDSLEDGCACTDPHVVADLDRRLRWSGRTDDLVSVEIDDVNAPRDRAPLPDLDRIRAQDAGVRIYVGSVSNSDTSSIADVYLHALRDHHDAVCLERALSADQPDQGTARSALRDPGTWWVGVVAEEQAPTDSKRSSPLAFDPRRPCRDDRHLPPATRVIPERELNAPVETAGSAQPLDASPESAGSTRRRDRTAGG